MANFQPIAAGRNNGLTSTPFYRGVEAASQSFVRGALLVDSSGSVAIGADSPTAGTILGIATHPASGTTGEEVQFIPALPLIEFIGTLDIAAGTYTLLGTERGNSYDFLLDAGGHFHLDQADTSAPKAVVTDLIDAVGTVSPRVVFQFLPGASIYTVAAS